MVRSESNTEELQHSLRKLNIEVHTSHLVDGFDICDNATWDPIEADLRPGKHDAFITRPPLLLQLTPWV